MKLSDSEKSSKTPKWGEKSYFETMYPVVCIARCFGLSPFKIETKEGRIEVLVSSSILVIYSYVFLVISFILQLIAANQSSSATVDITLKNNGCDGPHNTGYGSRAIF